MCKLVPALRVVGFVFLVLAILVCLVGFIAPFWIRIPVGDSLQVPSAETPITGQVTDREDVAPEAPASVPSAAVAGNGVPQLNQESTDRQQLTTTTTTLSPALGQASTTETSASQGIVNSISTLLNNGTYWGLWAMCHHNLTCQWFCQNNFKMEVEFPDWHKAVQGLYGLGLIVLLIALKTASFHVCCCHCCRESFTIATVIGSLTAAGLIRVTFALLIYVGFAAVTQTIELTGSRVFEWAFFVPVGGVALALIAAILFLVDGRRGPSDSDGDGEETAKMV